MCASSVTFGGVTAWSWSLEAWTESDGVPLLIPRDGPPVSNPWAIDSDSIEANNSSIFSHSTASIDYFVSHGFVYQGYGLSARVPPNNINASARARARGQYSFALDAPMPMELIGIGDALSVHLTGPGMSLMFNGAFTDTRTLMPGSYVLTADESLFVASGEVLREIESNGAMRFSIPTPGTWSLVIVGAALNIRRRGRAAASATPPASPTAKHRTGIS